MKPTRLQVALRRLIDSARDDREPLETVRTFADRLEAILREDLAGEEVGAWTHLETPTPWADRYLLAVKARARRRPSAARSSRSSSTSPDGRRSFGTG